MISPVILDKSLTKTLDLIQKIDNTKNRKSINLLVDGGINQKIIKEINCDKIVSGSAVLNSKSPILEIMRLQTALDMNYKKFSHNLNSNYEQN